MKRLIALTLFISTYCSGQSISITPTNSVTAKILEIKKNAFGLYHRSADNLIGIGTYVDLSNAYIQTHTNHPLRFTTNGGSTQLILATNGNFGVGNITPTQRLHVDGNVNVTGTTNTDARITGTSLIIGGGNPISKVLKVYQAGASIPSYLGNVCGEATYTVTGVGSDDTVILNIESSFSTLHVASVVPGENVVKVKFCNVSSTPVLLSTGNLRFTIIK
jgi:hypothetical protein